MLRVRDEMGHWFDAAMDTAGIKMQERGFF